MGAVYQQNNERDSMRHLRTALDENGDQSKDANVRVNAERHDAHDEDQRRSTKKSSATISDVWSLPTKQQTDPFTEHLR
jgi:hypothetical protein